MLGGIDRYNCGEAQLGGGGGRICLNRESGLPKLGKYYLWKVPHQQKPQQFQAFFMGSELWNTQRDFWKSQRMSVQ